MSTDHANVSQTFLVWRRSRMKSCTIMNKNACDYRTLGCKTRAI